MAGTAFNSSSLSGINVGVYSEEYSGLSDEIIKNLESEAFFVQKLETESACVDSVKKSTAHICIVFPKALSTEGNEQPATFYVDNSRTNIAYILVNKVNKNIETKASELGVVLAQNLIDTIASAKEDLPNEREGLNNAILTARVIEESTQEIASNIPDVNDTIAGLNEAKDILHSLNLSSSAEDDLDEKLDQAISDLTEIDNSKSSLTETAQSITEESAKARMIITGVATNIETILNELNSVTITEAEKVASPIKTTIKPLTAEESNWNYIFPLLISLVVLFGSVILSTTLVLNEKKTKAFFRNFITPTRDSTFVFGIYITVMLILLLQLAVLFAGTFWLTNINIAPVIGESLLIVFLGGTVFTLLGMFIGYTFKSEETAILASIIAASLLMFLSNTILPVESITGNIKYIAQFNPLVLTATALNKVILFGAPIMEMGMSALYLGGEILLMVILTAVSMKVAKRAA